MQGFSSASAGGDSPKVRKKNRRNSFLDLHAEATDVNGKNENQDSEAHLAPLNGDPSQACFMVFDGHGLSGRFISQFAVHRMTFYIQEKVKTLPKSKDCQTMQEWKDLVSSGIKECFENVDKELESVEIESMLSGTTATLALILEDHNIFIANCGDSRAVMGSVGMPGSLKKKLEAAPMKNHEMKLPDGRPLLNPEGTALLKKCREKLANLVPDGFSTLGYALCVDQNGTVPAEKQRVAAMGGECRKFHSDGPIRIFKKGKNLPGICPSRTIGDHYASRIGCISEPEVHYKRIKENDVVMILASDGLWDVVNNTEAADIALADSDPDTVTKELLVLAEMGNNDDGDRNEDNVTVQVIYLNDPLSKRDGLRDEDADGRTSFKAATSRSSKKDEIIATVSLLRRASILKDRADEAHIHDAGGKDGLYKKCLSVEELVSWYRRELDSKPGLRYRIEETQRLLEEQIRRENSSNSCCVL